VLGNLRVVVCLFVCQTVCAFSFLFYSSFFHISSRF
jgi:hypothetical protein